MARRSRGRRKAVRDLMAAKAGSGDSPSDAPEGKAGAKVDPPKDDSGDTVVIPEDDETFESARTIVDSPGPEPAPPQADSPAPRARSRVRKRTPLPKGRSSKKRRDGEDGEGKRGRTRAARPKGSPMPFIIMGAFVLGAVIIAAIVANDNERTRSRARATSDASSPVNSDPTGASPTPSTPAPAPKRGSTYVKIRFSLTGLTPKSDDRHMTAACGRCGTQLTSRVDTCPKPDCGAKLRWPEDNKVKCKFCCPRSRLKVDDLDEIPEDRRDGFCAYCKGAGKDPKFRPEMRRGLFGLDRTRPGGEAAPSGVGRCPVCKGTAKCTRCRGTGWVEVPNTFAK